MLLSVDGIDLVLVKLNLRFERLLRLLVRFLFLGDFGLEAIEFGVLGLEVEGHLRSCCLVWVGQ